MGFLLNRSHYHTADFWSRITHSKHIHSHFYYRVILDPPVFSKTQKGIIDVGKNYHNLINKVRPIITNQGYLITINNELFQSGSEHYALLESLCQSEYLSIDSIILVPTDAFGDRKSAKRLPAVPTPYCHSTKTTVLRVRKKEHPDL